MIGSFIFDSPRGTTFFPKLEEELKDRDSAPVLIKDEEVGIEYYYSVCKSRHMEDFTYTEGWNFFCLFSMLCNSFRPDVAMGYGTGVSGVAIHAEAKRRKIPFVYPICNANHPFYTFEDCEALFTDSQATADLYATRDRLNVLTSGIFIDPQRIVSKQRAPRYITMVNPSFSKGLSIFAKLAKVAQKELPELEFLAVDGRGSFAEFISSLHLPNSQKCPWSLKDFPNVFIAEHTDNMKEVYKITKVLLAPSIAYESWGRVASEAVLNGVPAVVSINGGLQEAIATAGISLEIPKECVKDHLRIPTDAEIKPWLNALKEALKRDFSKEFKHARNALSIESSTQRVLEILDPLFAKKAGNSPHIIQDGILRMEHDGNFR